MHVKYPIATTYIQYTHTCLHVVKLTYFYILYIYHKNH